MNRRGFFQTGLVAVGATITGCESKDPYALSAKPASGVAGWRRMEERSVATSCAQCPTGCVVTARVVQGGLVGLTGEPSCPINEGGIGPRGIAGVQALYDPDRIQQPLARTGPKGSPNFQPISWEQALKRLAERLSDLRARGEADKLLLLCGKERGTMRDLWQRFATSYGTPNFFTPANTHQGTIPAATWLMQGVRDLPAYDWKETAYVLALGAGVLEGSCQRIYMSRSSAHKSGHRAGRRARIVHVDPALSTTAVGADEWVPIRPSTHGAFALGLCHVIIKEGLYDHDFVAEHCTGFEDLFQKVATISTKTGITNEASATSATSSPTLAPRPGLETSVASYTPEKIAKICDIPASTITSIAREIASRRPAVAVLDPKVTLASNGLQTAMAVHCLNSLLGSIDRPGGVMVQRDAPLAPWPTALPDPVAQKSLGKRRLADPDAHPLGEQSSEELPGLLPKSGIDTALLYYHNPCYSSPAPERWRKALAALPFVVSFTPFMDETAGAFADLILPDHTYLERWEDAAATPSVGFPVFGLRQPVVKPLHNTRATGDLVIELASKLNTSVASAFPWKDFREALEVRIEGLHSAQAGTIVANDKAEFLAKLRETGFWAQSPYRFERWEETLRNDSQRIELHLSRLKELADRSAKARSVPVAEVLRGWNMSGDLKKDLVPSLQEPRYHGSIEEFPLALIPYRPGTYSVGSGANLPWLAELAGWESTAELNQEAAAALGIKDGDTVEVASPTGSLRMRAQLVAGIRPDCLRIACGRGHRGFGRFADGIGVNVMELLVPDFEALTGVPAMVGTRVRVTKV